MTKDLERLSRTRRMPVSHRPDRPDAVMVGTATELALATREGQGIRAIGRYVPRPEGGYAVPVVYVSKRAKPWHERRWVHVSSIVVGSILVLGALAAWAILSIGLAMFLALVIGIPTAGLVLAGYLKYRGGRSVSVSMTTTTNVRVR